MIRLCMLIWIFSVCIYDMMTFMSRLSTVVATDQVADICATARGQIQRGFMGSIEPLLIQNFIVRNFEFDNF